MAKYRDIISKWVKKDPQNLYMSNPTYFVNDVNGFPQVEKIDNGILFPEIPKNHSGYKPGD